MEYATKSIIIGRMKRKDPEDNYYPVFVTLFDINEPQASGQVPKDRLEFKAKRVILKGFNETNYLLAGNDLVVNDLTKIKIEQTESAVIVENISK